MAKRLKSHPKTKNFVAKGAAKRLRAAHAYLSRRVPPRRSPVPKGAEAKIRATLGGWTTWVYLPDLGRPAFIPTAALDAEFACQGERDKDPRNVPAEHLRTMFGGHPAYDPRTKRQQAIVDAAYARESVSCRAWGHGPNREALHERLELVTKCVQKQERELQDWDCFKGAPVELDFAVLSEVLTAIYPFAPWAHGWFFGEALEIMMCADGHARGYLRLGAIAQNAWYHCPTRRKIDMYEVACDMALYWHKAGIPASHQRLLTKLFESEQWRNCAEKLYDDAAEQAEFEYQEARNWGG